jgi:hypothetical protein
MDSLNAPFQLVEIIMSIGFNVERVSRMVNIFKNRFCGELFPGKRFNNAK